MLAVSVAGAGQGWTQAAEPELPDQIAANDPASRNALVDDRPCNARGRDISFTLVPRYQPFITTVGENDDLGLIQSGGLTGIVFDSCRSGFALSLTGFAGRQDGATSQPLTGDSTFIFRRGDASAYVEYRPTRGSVTVFTGPRFFSTEFDATRPGIGLSDERDDEDYAIWETGLRFQGKLREETPFVFTAQASLGFGYGRRVRDGGINSNLAITEGFVPAPGADRFYHEEEGLGTLAEFAIGTNYLLDRRFNLAGQSAQNFTIGARLRAYVLAIDIQNNSPNLTLSPEINLSATF